MTLMSQAQLAVQPDPTVRRFERETGSLWPFVAPLMARYEGVIRDPDEALMEVTSALRKTSSIPAAKQLANDLIALLPGWKFFSATQRCVLQTAAAFLAKGGDGEERKPVGDSAADEPAPDSHRTDADIVVAAAVRALLRRSQR